MPLPKTANHSLILEPKSSNHKCRKDYQDATCLRVVQLELWIFQGTVEHLEELLKKGEYYIHHVKYIDSGTKAESTNEKEVYKFELRRWL